MVVLTVDVLRKSKAFHPDHVVRHQEELGDFTLEIRHSWAYSLELVFPNRDSCIIESWDPYDEEAREKAERLYGDVLAKLRSGQFVLHISDDGSSELELK